MELAVVQDSAIAAAVSEKFAYGDKQRNTGRKEGALWTLAVLAVIKTLQEIL